MKRDKNKKNEKKQDREPTSAEISMRAKQGEGAFVDEDDESDTNIKDRKARPTSEDPIKR